MSSGVLAVDERGRIAMLNAGAQRILGCPAGDREAAIRRPCSEVLAGQPTVANLLLDALDGRRVQSRAELVLEGVGTHMAITIGFTLTPVVDAAGDVRGAAMIFRDLTPFERMDEQQRLTERLSALGQMAAGLAHEIRNPLAGMEIVAGLLKRRLGDRDDERKLVAQLTGELRRLAQTVTDCLEFVRPISPERGPTDPVALVEECLATALTRTQFDGAIERAFDEEIPAISADSAQLRAVVTNLILNALEAMPGDNDGRARCLRLGVSELESSHRMRTPGRGDAGPDREIVISVSDSGPGVPESIRDRIFYPFFTTKQTGSGVGLATAQKIAASHGGALELDPGSGPGATFRLRLPVGAEKP